MRQAFYSFVEIAFSFTIRYRNQIFFYQRSTHVLKVVSAERLKTIYKIEKWGIFKTLADIIFERHCSCTKIFSVPHLYIQRITVGF